MAKQSKTSELDKKINEARANLAKKGKAPKRAAKAAKKTAPKTGRKRLSDEERAAREAKREAEKAEKAAARAAKKAAREAKREAEKSQAHLKKVEKARARLPELSEEAQSRHDGAVSNLSVEDVEALAKHLELYAREQRTRQALDTSLEVGQTVRITGGDPRFIGQEATVAKVQRIRCYVKVEGQEALVYLFTSDCTPVSAASASTGTDG